jgi:hypothetical protein
MVAVPGRHETSPVPFTVAAVLVVGYAAYRFHQVRPRMKALRQGQEGEKAVGQFLERLREDGFQVFHDVVGPGFNIDHVLIGPSGVFSVETKTRSKPERGNAEVTFDGASIRVAGQLPDRDPLAQAKAQARWLKAILAESTGRTPEVRPVVLFPGWFVNATAGQHDVWVLEPKALPAFLARQSARVDPEGVKLLSYHLSRFIRAVEKEKDA